ncbi:MAG TPA: prepilin peptidase [Microbacterium sp.]|uniref:prepilin peptidase n=1 Tax=Microbacterium sp. TaxID=51671 RepID=UPI002CF90E8E|nr:prepilin peptidase [Microbacterium sp.]HWI32484.1 prepilin peptidase [Microbacterium sp.]
MTALAPAALVFALVFAGLFGLVIGSFLNVVVYRVPAGIPLTRASRCPSCDEPVRPWQNVPVVSWLALKGRCASCGSPISARYPLVEAATGVAFVAVTWLLLASASQTGSWLAPNAPFSGATLVVVLIAFLYLAAISIALMLIDLDTHRLPNAIVLPSYVVAGVLLTLACLLEGDNAAFIRSVVGGIALYAFYFVLRLIRPAGMGGGDVTLAGVLGLYLGYVGWGALIVGAFAAFVLGGVFGLILVVARRAGRRSAIPFGPWMIGGAWVGIAAGEPIASWYLGLVGLA